MHHRAIPFVLLPALLLGSLPDLASAQRYIVLPKKGERPEPEPRTEGDPAREAARNKTRVHVEILTGRLGGGLHAQEWARVLRDVDVEGRVRQMLSTDKLGVFETNRGPLRDVRIIGRLEPDGSVRFEDRKLASSEGARLKEWVDELATFGVQGAPEGKPLWGLNRAQFEEVRRGLSNPVPEGTVGRPVRTSVGSLGVPRTLPIRVSEDARPVFADIPRTANIGEHVAGMTAGTAVACVLREYGLGVRPTRTPEGALELVVVPLAKTEDVWPVGWEFEGSRPKAMPKMFALVPVRLEDSKLTDVLDVIAARTEVPILLDQHGIAEAGIDLAELRTSYPPKTTSWSLLLRNVLGPHRLIREFRTDEAGKVFCWVTVFRPGPVGE